MFAYPIGLLLLNLVSYQCYEINHIVVLMEENRPFDHIFGWSTNLNVNGLTGNEYNLVDPSNSSSDRVYVSNNCPYINECDPSHGTSATTYKIFSGLNENVPANNGGFVSYESAHKDKNYCDVMSGFTPDRLPVINALASEYAVMDRFFASHPGPTWPNRMFALSGTSAGSTETSVWYKNIRGKLFPQRTIFDQLEESGHTWRNYYNDTPWELFMEKIAHNTENLQPMEAFYRDASTGNLPSFAWINPRSGINITTGVGSNDQHPDHDMNAGEQYMKDIYEALRASPQWNETLFIITYDEHGGFYDHVIPPSVDIPAPNDGEKSYPTIDFQFNRLGMRIPTLLISPWVRKGLVISEPPSGFKPYLSSEFDLTSILSTTRKLLNMPSTPLTARDEWAATFEFAFEDIEQPRNDCPLHLPDAFPPQVMSTPEELLPLNQLQTDIADVHAFLSLTDIPETLLQQGQHSEWVQQQYSKHCTRTQHWKSMKSNLESSSYRLVAQSCDVYSAMDENNWNLNGLKYGGNSIYSHSEMPFITISTRDLRVAITNSNEKNDGTPLCLDAGNGTIGTMIIATPCYPTEDPSLNRDVSQHFVLNSDGTLKFYDETVDASDYLCVTNTKPELGNDESLNVYLAQCDGSVLQSWSFHGSAPGDGGNGKLEYGDVANCLGLIGV
jgi:phospholipase C